MKRYSLLTFICGLLLFSNAYSGECFLLYDVKKQQLVERHDTENQCKQRIGAHSTFKVALSMMAFDSHLISQKTQFKWDHVKRDFVKWDHDQTPKTWLHDSVVWVSQQITPKLGMKKISYYLKMFHYGNEDFTGDPGKHNGLTHAWLGSSLKLSAEEQLEFLIKFYQNKLPLQSEAIESTKQNMYLETLANGWRLYGKSGSSHLRGKTYEGWFVGFIQKANDSKIFVTNFVAPVPKGAKRYGGHIAREKALKRLSSI